MEVAMSIPTRLSSYLDQRGTRYEILLHRHSRSSAETARAAEIPAHQLAKSVMVEDDTGFLMAVVPADRNVQLGQLARLLHREHLRLADETTIATMFADCDRGAVPTLGMAWNVPTVIDDELEANEVVYLESGDHERLLCLASDQFRELMLAARHGHFCGERVH
jgi:Ala-tRNA(Pro) deacylase